MTGSTILVIIAIVMCGVGLVMIIVGVILDARTPKAYGDESVFSVLGQIFTKLFDVVFTDRFTFAKRLMGLGMMLIVLGILAGAASGITSAVD